MEAAVRELEERLARYPAERYPVQHATALFHLGALRGDPASLARAAELFAQAGLEEEHAKSANALGAALRDRGDADGAAAAFADAAAAFARLGLAEEEGAAIFNLGLVRRDVALLARARELLARTSYRGAAAREHGALLLAEGELEAAGEALEEAHRLGDPGAPNALGLVRLAEGRPRDAVELFRQAASAHPRSVRPAEHAMAKANLALAWERAGDLRRARLAAKQALRVPDPPSVVVAQAGQVLASAGEGRGDLHAVLDEDARVEVVREEVARWADEEDGGRAALADWLEDDPDDARETLLVEALLELPPDRLELLLRSYVAVADAADLARLRRVAASFHLPQQERFERLLDAAIAAGR